MLSLYQTSELYGKQSRDGYLGLAGAAMTVKSLLGFKPDEAALVLIQNPKVGHLSPLSLLLSLLLSLAWASALLLACVQLCVSACLYHDLPIRLLDYLPALVIVASRSGEPRDCDGNILREPTCTKSVWRQRQSWATAAK